MSSATDRVAPSSSSHAATRALGREAGRELAESGIRVNALAVGAAAEPEAIRRAALELAVGSATGEVVRVD